MQNLPIVYGNNAPVPAELEQQLQTTFDESFAQLGAGTFRVIRLRKLDFLLKDGQAETVVPADRMFGVLLRAAPVNHAVWYERRYAPGQEPSRPDLVWKMPTPDTFHPALPEQFHTKRVVDGKEAWAFQIIRRTVWALLRMDAQGQAYLDLENPYVLDISSMSLFGAGMPAQHFYKFAGLRVFCSQMGGGRVVTPNMFITQILIDPSVNLSGVMLFRPQLNPDGTLALLDTSLIQAIVARSNSAEVRDLCEVTEQDNYSNKSTPSAPVQTASAVASPAPVQAPVAPTPAQPTVPPVAPAPVQAPVAPAPAQPAAPAPAPVQPAAPAPAQTAATDTAHLLAQAQKLFDQTAPQPEPGKTNAAAVNEMLARLQS